MRRQVVRRRAHRHPARGEAARHHAVVRQIADPHRQVVAALHQVYHPVVHRQVQLDVRIAVQELRRQRRQVQPAESHRRGNPQQTLRPALQPGRHLLRLAGQRERAAGAVVIALAGLGQAQTAGGPLQQPHVQARLQLLHPLADRGLGQAQPGGGGGKAAGFDHGDEYRYRGEMLHPIVHFPSAISFQKYRLSVRKIQCTVLPMRLAACLSWQFGALAALIQDRRTSPCSHVIPLPGR